MDIHFLSVGERPKNHFAILLIENEKMPPDWSNYHDVALHAKKIPFEKDISIHQSFHHQQLAVDSESIIFVQIKAKLLENDDAMDQIGSTISNWCKNNEISYLSLLSPFSSKKTAQIAMAIHLSAYRFYNYKTKDIEKLHRLKKLNIIHNDPQKVRIHYKPLSAIISGINFCRDLVSEPSNILTPANLAQRLYETLKPAGVIVEVLDEQQMKDLGMNALLAVGMGSNCQSKMVVMQWQGGKKDEKPIALLGKGVCFDSGGISLKPGRNMHEMKFDMAGAAAVAGSMLNIAKQHIPMNIVGIVGLVENMPDGKAYKPGDIITSMSGQTIEVLNTDAEGRMVLSDVLWYTQERFSPKYMIDFATLTGAVIAALGTEYAGLFGNDEDLKAILMQASKQSRDKLWPMPMSKVFDGQINSSIADMKNIGDTPHAGHITAAQFLARFVKDHAWSHIDIAGVAWAHKSKPCIPVGATGYGISLIDAFLKLIQEKSE
ncbi:MAG: leucyl aminopeptidase [Gammaproteobacteria bacterium]|jgi:leucyl aminopeptidase|nr:leucyl aminopeptidase [Gammaproteobacteria bacterium]